MVPAPYRTVRRIVTQGDRPRLKAETREIWWEVVFLVGGLHLLTLLTMVWIAPWSYIDWRTKVLGVVNYNLGIFAMTLGLHRLWSHKSYVPARWFEVLLGVGSFFSFQGSIKWWVLRHRLHHRWTDSDADPYDARRGFWFTHVGWMLYKPRYMDFKLLDRKDVDTNWIIQLNHKYYVPATFWLTFAGPLLVGYSYGKPLEAFLWGAIIAKVACWNFTWNVNSIAHIFGDQPYTDEITARGNFWVALLCAGEGNHNFHHAFPHDYRNALRWSEYDPTAWFINLLWYLGIVKSVHKTPDSEIIEGQIRMLKINKEKQDVAESDMPGKSSLAFWSEFAIGNEADSSSDAASSDGGSASLPTPGPTPTIKANKLGITESEKEFMYEKSTSAKAAEYFVPTFKRREDEIPTWTRAQLADALNQLVEKDPKAHPIIVIINNYAVDMTLYAPEHPGGVLTIKQFAIPTKKDAEKQTDFSKWPDATDGFFGGLNNHFYTSITRMEMLRIAKLSD